MLYLAPMAKNCRFPRRGHCECDGLRARPREDKLPIQVRASSEEGKRGRRNPIPLLSFLPLSLFSLSCPHNVTSTFSLHSHVRRSPSAFRGDGTREMGRILRRLCSPHLPICHDRERGARKEAGAVKPRACHSGAGRGYLLLGYNTPKFGLVTLMIARMEQA